jgi:pimeloyl-ACP methyl ester carboxylesterase
MESYKSLDALDNTDQSDKLPPICTIWGVENRILSAKAGRILNSTAIAPKREAFIEDCGHLVMLEDPDQVAILIHEFILEESSS